MNIQKLLDQARKNFEIGNSNESLVLLKKILTKYPKQPVAHANLGAIYNARKEFQLAEHHFIHSLNIVFQSEVFSLLVVMYMQNHLWEKARDLYLKHDTQIKKDAANLLNYAIILRELGNINESIDIYQKVLSLYPKYIECYISFGFTLNKLQRYKDAIKVYKKGLALDTNNYRLTYNIGIAYLNQFNYDDAIYYFELTLTQNKSSIDLLLTLAVCYSKKRNFSAAIKSIENAGKIDPKNPLVPFQLGTLLMQQERNEEALMWLKKVVEMDPNHIEAKYHIGLIYLKLEDYKKAMGFYRYRVLRKENKLGKFNDFNVTHLDKKSKLIISNEQGIGDEILYLSMLDEIKDQVRLVTYIVQDKLYKWVSLNISKIELIKESESQKYLEENKDSIIINAASMMNFINNWDRFFSKEKIWKADVKIKEEYRKKYKKNNKKMMGISWMSRNEKIGDEKTIPLEKMMPLFEGHQVISLQYGDVQGEIENMNQKNSSQIYFDKEIDYYNDINSLASLVSICDFIITCSNVTAHIAGRLGIKTFLLVPKYFGNIWYWVTEKNQSKWYPSISIIRQKEDGDWDDVINQVKERICIL